MYRNVKAVNSIRDQFRCPETRVSDANCVRCLYISDSFEDLGGTKAVLPSKLVAVCFYTL